MCLARTSLFGIVFVLLHFCVLFGCYLVINTSRIDLPGETCLLCIEWDFKLYLLTSFKCA